MSSFLPPPMILITARTLARHLAGSIVAFHCLAAQAESDDRHDRHDLTGLSIEELMNVEVTSVSKKPVRLLDAAAAIHVISSDDIRRSGATSIPELLRTVPGIHVASGDSNKWAVTARGFTGRFANKLLVLMDGRSVYTPIFSGVFWEVQDTLLEDIERIEVIRGPGASVWGANAVNGVINIITKSAKDTQGGLLTGIAGTEERANLAARYGSRLGEEGYFRVFAKHLRRDEGKFAAGTQGADDWQISRGGFRYDLRPDEIAGRDTLTLHGEAYDGTLNQTLSTPSLTTPFAILTNDAVPVNGQNLFARWERRLARDRNYSVQAYLSRAERIDPVLKVEEMEFDLEFQNRFRLGPRHDFVWGLGYRLNVDSIGNTFSVAFDPDSRSLHLFNAFIEDQIQVLDGVTVTRNEVPGARIEVSGARHWHYPG